MKPGEIIAKSRDVVFFFVFVFVVVLFFCVVLLFLMPNSAGMLPVVQSVFTSPCESRWIAPDLRFPRSVPMSARPTVPNGLFTQSD